MLRLLASPALATAMGEAGQAHIAAEYGWPRAVSGLVSVLAPAFGARTHVGTGAPVRKR